MKTKDRLPEKIRNLFISVLKDKARLNLRSLIMKSIQQNNDPETEKILLQLLSAMDTETDKRVIIDALKSEGFRHPAGDQIALSETEVKFPQLNQPLIDLMKEVLDRQGVLPLPNLLQLMNIKAIRAGNEELIKHTKTLILMDTEEVLELIENTGAFNVGGALIGN